MSLSAILQRQQNELFELIAKAEKYNFWLHDPDTGLWFSPSEMKQAIQSRSPQLSLIGWEIHDPGKLIAAKKSQILAIADEIVDLKMRINRG